MDMQGHYVSMSEYNMWANTQLFADVSELTAEQQIEDVGIYFRSILSTLTHMLGTDRAWTFILRGGALPDMRLPPPPTNFAQLNAERQEEDRNIVAWMRGVSNAWLSEPFNFTSGLGSFSGKTYKGTHGSALTHVFNHQTHHRGQVHAALTRLGVSEPRALDILVKGFDELASTA